MLAEHVRMAADHLVGDRASDVGEGEAAGFLGHARVVDDLEQQIAEFVRQSGEVAPSDRVGDFVGFLDRVGRDRAKVCSWSQGQPRSGSRSAAMMSSKRRSSASALNGAPPALDGSAFRSCHRSRNAGLALRLRDDTS